MYFVWVMYVDGSELSEVVEGELAAWSRRAELEGDRVTVGALVCAYSDENEALLRVVARHVRPSCPMLDDVAVFGDSGVA